MIRQGDIWWADLGPLSGSAPALRRPLLVVQGDAFNRRGITTVICVPLTTNLRRAEDPGNVLLSSEETSLAKDSVANISQIIALDKGDLDDYVGTVSRAKIDLVLQGIALALGR